MDLRARSAGGQGDFPPRSFAQRHYRLRLRTRLDFAQRRQELRLGGDRALAGRGQGPLVGLARGLRRPRLGIRGGIDGRAVLAADVVSLAHALGRVVALPEELQQLVVGDDLRIEHHLHRLGLSGIVRRRRLGGT